MTRKPDSASTGTPTRLSLMVILVLGVYNVLLKLAIPAWAHVGSSVLVAFGLVLLARGSGLSWFDIGFGGRRLRGLGRGLAAAGIVLVGLTLLAAIPASRQLLADTRFVGLSAWTGARKVFIEIPLTVGFEEIAFRGVLLGALLRTTSVLRAALLSTAVFGLWHVLSTLELLEMDRDLPLESSPLVLLGTLTGVTVVGLVFTWLRLADRSVLSPFAVHVTLNGVGYVMAWMIVTWQL